MRNASEAQIKSLKAALAAERAKTAGLQESLALTIKSNEQLAARVNAAETKLAEAQAEARLYRDNAAQAMTWFEQLKSERAKTAKLVEALEELVEDVTHADHRRKDWSEQVVVKRAREALAAAKASE